MLENRKKQHKGRGLVRTDTGQAVSPHVITVANRECCHNSAPTCSSTAVEKRRRRNVKEAGKGVKTRTHNTRTEAEAAQGLMVLLTAPRGWAVVHEAQPGARPGCPPRHSLAPAPTSSLPEGTPLCKGPAHLDWFSPSLALPLNLGLGTAAARPTLGGKGCSENHQTAGSWGTDLTQEGRDIIAQL